MKRKGRLQALATQPPSHTATPQATEKEEKKRCTGIERDKRPETKDKWGHLRKTGRKQAKLRLGIQCMTKTPSVIYLEAEWRAPQRAEE